MSLSVLRNGFGQRGIVRRRPVPALDSHPMKGEVRSIVRRHALEHDL
jgi:hypothetical protein